MTNKVPVSLRLLYYLCLGTSSEKVYKYDLEAVSAFMFWYRYLSDTNESIDIKILHNDMKMVILGLLQREANE